MVSEDLARIREAVREAGANLWEWNGVNPYRDHPLRVLGLESKEVVLPAAVATAVRREEERAIHDRDATNEAGGSMPAVQAAELLRHPVTRVICELLRVPPVEVPANDLKELRALAKEIGGMPALPSPARIGVHEDALVETFLAFVRELRAEEWDVPTADFGPAPEFPHGAHVGIEFRPRRPERR